MKNNLKNLTMSLLALCLLTITACKKDEKDPPFALTALKAGDTDLNGANSATGVPANATITATFSQNLDPTSAVTLQRDYDDANLNVTVTASGNTLTIDPAEDLGGGTLYLLQLNGIKSQKGEALAPVERSFTTSGTFLPAGQIAFFSFDGDASDQVSSFDPSANDIVAINFGADHKGAAGKAAEFNGDNSIIEVPNGSGLINADNLTLSFWVKTNSAGHVDAEGNPAGHFVMGLGAFNGLQFEIPADYAWAKFAVQYLWADGSTGTGGDLFFNGDGKTAANGGWQGTEVRKDLTSSGGVATLLKDKWAHITYVFDKAAKTRSMYINGELMQKDNFNLWPAADKERTASGVKFNPNADVENKLAFGFIHSRGGILWDSEPWGGYDFPTANHFKGTLDDVRFFHKPLTAQEIKLMYDSEK
jgi:hypothetical protein